MDDKDHLMDLPPEIACIHRKWSVRSISYRSLISHFKKLEPSSDEWATYKNVLPNIAGETFPAIKEQALEVIFHFVKNCETAHKSSTQVVHSLLDTIPTNIKPRTKQLLEKIILQYVEIGSSKDVIEELLRTALINQAPNVATPCIEFITKILSVFGPKAIDLPYVLETLPYLQETEDSELRSATKTLILEIYRWQGKESIKNVEQILNPTDLKDVMKKYEDVKNKTQLKPTRHVRNNKNKSENFQGEDLMKKMNEDFFKKLDSSEWTERRDALAELRNTLDKLGRLRPGNYEPLLAALKKVIIEDQCVIVVGLAIACVTGIAEGLQTQFSPYATGICRILLEKFVEKRQNITEQLRKALDVLITTTSFESLIKTINSFLASKNPTIRFETIQLLSRMFKNANRQTLRKSEFSILYKSLVNCLHHGQLIIREKSFIALAVAFKIAGEGVIMPYLESVDPTTKIRIKNYNLDQDFEEKYNEIKYRNVAKKEFKNEDKPKCRINESSDSNLKECEKLDSEINSYLDSPRANFKTDTQKKRIKSLKKIENQTIFNFNKVTKRWSTTNSNLTLEKFYSNSESKKSIENIIEVTTPYKEHRKKENLVRYPYRKPYTVQIKDTNLYSKEKRKKKRIIPYKRKYTPVKITKQFLEKSEQIGDTIIMNVTKVSDNGMKAQNEFPYPQSNNPRHEYSYEKATHTNSNQTVKLMNCTEKDLIKSRDVSNNETIRNDSSLIRENSEMSQLVQQSVQTPDSKSGEGFIVLTENEVKKLLGLKRISAVNDDAYTILPDWASKKSLFKRSYKIFQVSKGAIDRETQTSSTAVESNIEITPERGLIDLVKTVDEIPTQTAYVSIQEKGTDAHRVKRYNRGTQWVRHLHEEFLESKREASSDWQAPEQKKLQQHKEKETPLKMQSVVMKKIEYRRPSMKDVRREWRGTGADHASKRTMQINTFTVTRSDPIHLSKKPSDSLTSDLNTSNQEIINNKYQKERKQNVERKEKKRQKQPFTKSHNSEEKVSKNSNDSRQIKKIKRKYMHEIMVRSNKETTESRQDDISSQTLIRLKKIERTRHRSVTKASPRRDLSKSQMYASHTSDVSIHRSNRKGRRSLFTQSSKFRFENFDTSSGSCKEGCNFLPLMAKSIMGRQNEQNEKKGNARKKQNKNKSNRNARRGNRPNNNTAEIKKSEFALNKQNSRKSPSPPGREGQEFELITDARDMDPQTKQMVINELLKVCDISQDTFEKMVRRKVPPPRSSLFTPKAVIQRVNDLTSAELDTPEDRSNKEHKSCVIM